MRERARSFGYRLPPFSTSRARPALVVAQSRERHGLEGELSDQRDDDGGPTVSVSRECPLRTFGLYVAVGGTRRLHAGVGRRLLLRGRQSLEVGVQRAQFIVIK